MNRRALVLLALFTVGCTLAETSEYELALEGRGAPADPLHEALAESQILTAAEVRHLVTLGEEHGFTVASTPVACGADNELVLVSLAPPGVDLHSLSFRVTDDGWSSQYDVSAELASAGDRELAVARLGYFPVGTQLHFAARETA